MHSKRKASNASVLAKNSQSWNVPKQTSDAYSGRTISQANFSSEPSRTHKKPDHIRKNIDTQPWLQNIVIKPARQSGGKGVKLIEDRQIYLHDAKERFKEAYFDSLQASMAAYSDIEDKILVEEKAWGPEYSLQCFTD